MEPPVSPANGPHRRSVHRSAWAVFRMPLLVGVVCAAGLALALVGDGIWDGLSWLALSTPIALVVFYWRRAPVRG